MDNVRPVRAGWYNAFRPWTLHGAIVPVVLGGLLAYHDGYSCWWIFALALIGGCLLQSAANLLNTYGDYDKGLDNIDNHSRSPELVSGALEPKKVLYAGMACLAVTALIGVVFIGYTGWGILVFGLLGIAGAGLYTMGLSYKYHGFGLISVFLMMGILMSLGTYYLLTGTVGWYVILVSLPNALLITAVLSGNEMRDFRSDSEGGVITTSVRLGYARGLLLYQALCTAPYLILVALVLTGYLPYPSLLAMLTLYMWWRVMENSRRAEGDRHSGFMMVPMAFKLNWVFGALLMTGYVIAYYVI